MSILLRRYYQLLRYSRYGIWLSDATMRTILGAFGDNGNVVIKATNAYLNVLAASDRAKAQTLAALINEDPMMVCSIGLQPQGVTMPIRWLVGDGVAYINLNYNPTKNDDVRLIAKGNGIYGQWLFGTRRNAGGTMNVTFSLVNTDATTVRAYMYCAGAVGQNYSTVRPYGASDVIQYETNGNKFTMNGVEYNLPSRLNTTIDASLFVLALNDASGVIGQSPASVSIFDVKGKRETASFVLGNPRAASECYPQKACAAGTGGMIDILTGTFYPNANTSGSFSIEYTLPDGTPWTPGTPLP